MAASDAGKEEGIDAHTEPDTFPDPLVCLTLRNPWPRFFTLFVMFSGGMLLRSRPLQGTLPHGTFLRRRHRHSRLLRSLLAGGSEHNKHGEKDDPKNVWLSPHPLSSMIALIISSSPLGLGNFLRPSVGLFDIRGLDE